MKRQIIKLFEDNNHQYSEVVKRGVKQGFTKAQILEGMKSVYDRIKAGENIKPINMVWEAWDVAKKVQGKEFLAYEYEVDELVLKIKELKRIFWVAYIGSMILIITIIANFKLVQ